MERPLVRAPLAPAIEFRVPHTVPEREFVIDNLLVSIQGAGNRM